MQRQIALLICIVFILWLFARDQKLRPMTSMALWIPLLWIFIIGTRPVSLWLSLEGPRYITPEIYDGSPLDRNVFLFLIVVGMLILLNRRINWSTFFSFNRWFIVFLFFSGISCFWSDYAFIAFKRYIKEIGNVIMALIIITETSPVQAVKAVLARYTYIIIIISVLFIKYFPDLGRFYIRGTWAAVHTGITTDKNSLGQIVLISGLFITWELIQSFIAEKRSLEASDLLSRGVLMAMVVWLLYMSNSSTSIACIIIGVGIFFFLRFPFAKKFVNVFIYILIVLSIIIPFSINTGFLQPFTEILNRDVTLTGRTEIWVELLKISINPLIGKGFESFWLTPEAIKMGDRYGFLFNQAHNGFLEIYAHTGLIGLSLFIVTIIAVVKNMKNLLLLGNNYVILRYTFLINLLFYNWTEATIHKLSVMWFFPMMALLYYPDPSQTMTKIDDGRNNMIEFEYNGYNPDC